MKTKTFILLLCLAAVMALSSGCSGERQKAIRVNDTLDSFSGTDLKGNSFSLASHKNNPVIVRFFLTNCPYCEADTPIFNKFYNKFNEKGLEIVYINNNGANLEEVQNFVDKLKINFPVIYDPKGKIARKYNVRIQPLTLILSPEHKLLAALMGGVSEAELDELLGRYFEG